MSLCWVIGSQMSNDILNINISKFHNIFNSKLALISFFLLFLIACLPIKYLKESLLFFMFFVHNIIFVEHTRSWNMRCITFLIMIIFLT